MQQKKIYLFQPGAKEGVANTPPIGILHLASVLKEAKYDVKIVDIRVEDYQSIDLNDTLFCGITAFTGTMVTWGLKIAKFIRDKNPEIPIVWGGVHASILPKQTCEHPLVDMVVKGEGEKTVVELAKALESGSTLEDIEGVVYKNDEEIIENPDRPFIDLNELPYLPYELLNSEKYNLSTVYVHTSRGCPYNCKFCYNRNYNKLSYRSKEPERVLDEIEYVLKKFGSNVTEISFVEDNFFVSRKRVEKICKGLIDRKINIKWSALCRVDYFSKYSDEFIDLLVKSGCRAIAFGAESGSEKVLESINKGIKVEDTLTTIKRCKEFGIASDFSFVIGLPGETRRDIYKTMDLIDERERIDHHNGASHIFIYVPYPGTPLFADAVKMGFDNPSSLEEWGDLYFGGKTKIFPDCQSKVYGKKHARLLETLFGIVHIIFQKHSTTNPIKRAMIGFLMASGKFRWRHKFFSFPIEWMIFQIYFRKTGYG
jgi:radical SAM superfamily enzyme YgiQ (UPF0313 family)